MAVTATKSLYEPAEVPACPSAKAVVEPLASVRPFAKLKVPTPLPGSGPGASAAPACTVVAPPTLPVLLVELADQDGTLLYIDPVDGRLLSKLDKSRRWNRWLSSGLHHWNFGWLYYRPVWDIWMLFWVGFGLVLSASSLVIGWRRLQKTFTPKKHRIQPATQLPDNAQEASVNVSN